MSTSIDKLSAFVNSLALDAGELSLQAFQRLTCDDIEFKSPKDLVTAADREVEDFIISKINDEYPGHAVFGEETGHRGDSEYCWIIDPIDGTASFVHELPFYSISIALYCQNEPLVAAVFGPRLNELFHAAKGRGAYLGERKLHVSSRAKLIDAMLCTGFACIRGDLPRNNLPYFERLVKCSRGMRRHGSAALDLCYVAAGRLDGFWELNLKPYDYAAGILILQEAGGCISDFSGFSDYSGNGIVATNGLLHSQMLAQIKLAETE
jgi:myo-inositol-1(or 4)-monophosphatase